MGELRVWACYRRGGGSVVDGAAMAAELGRHMRRRGYDPVRLASETGVSRASIYRWLRGDVTRPYHGEGILRVANVLELNKVEANRLLRAFQQASIDQLAASLTSEQLPLLRRWTTHTRNNLPADLTSFVGREEETLEIASLLCRGDVRLVTLTGPGGAGKTRLGLRVANELHDVFPDGIFCVSLATVNDPALVLQTIARTLEVRDVAGQSTDERLAGYLRERRVLLMLDNMEQVVDAGPEVVALLQQAGQVKALVTSRAPLHVSGEFERPVPLLELPGTDASLKETRASPAVALFAVRAEAVDPDFGLTRRNAASVARICERLDGSPLAIELAAARCRRFSPEELLQRFPSLLDLGADGPRDVSQRQRSLRATIDWSYELLSPEARTLFRRLAVFSGGWTVDAAVAVCGELDGALSELSEASLIVRSASQRYGMLETIREYAQERLSASGEEADRWQQHALYFLILAEARVPYIPQTRQPSWLERVDQEHDNFRSALGWATSQEHAELTLRLAGALWPYWHEYGHFREGKRWLEMAIAVGDGLPRRWLGSVLTGALTLSYSLGELTQAQAYGEAALVVWHEIGNQHGPALVLLYLGLIRSLSGDYLEALELYKESLGLWTSIDQPLGVALCKAEMGMLLSTIGQFGAAEAALAEAHALYEKEQDPGGLTRAYLDRGLTALLQFDLVKAIDLLQQGIEMSRQLGENYHLHSGLYYLGIALCFASEDDATLLDTALVHLSESVRLKHAAGDKYGLSYALLGFAAVAHRQGQAARSATLCGAVVSIQKRTGIVMNPAVQAIYNHEIQTVRDQLTESEFNTAFAAGEEMTVDEAAQFALGGAR